MVSRVRGKTWGRREKKATLEKFGKFFGLEFLSLLDSCLSTHNLDCLVCVLVFRRSPRPAILDPKRVVLQPHLLIH